MFDITKSTLANDLVPSACQIIRKMFCTDSLVDNGKSFFCFPVASGFCQSALTDMFPSDSLYRCVKHYVKDVVLNGKKSF